MSRLPTVETYRRRRQIIVGLTAGLSLLIVSLVSLDLTSLPNVPMSLTIARNSSNWSIPLAIIVAGLLVALLTLRWPIVGAAVALFGIYFFEPFPIAYDPTTDYAWRFHANLQSWSAIPLPVSTVECLLLLTTGAWLIQMAHRRQWSSVMGWLGWPLIALLMALGFGFGVGILLHGGDIRIALWEIRGLASLIWLYFLMGALFRSPRTINLHNWIMVMALIPNGARLLWRTTLIDQSVADENTISGLGHENAVFLAVFVIFWLAQWSFGKNSLQRWVATLGLPLVLGGLLVSQRRSAFAVLMLGGLVWVAFLFFQRRKLFWIVIPPLAAAFLIMIVLFWESPGLLGQPARTIRSVIGAAVSERDQLSDLYRRVEEYNIWRTIRDGPLTGVGFGVPFNEYLPISFIGNWDFQFYTPHNQVFWLWLKMGAVGFAISLWVFGNAISGCVRLMRQSDDPVVKPFVVTTLALTIMMLAFSYVDIGLANQRAMLLLGSLLGIVGALPMAIPATESATEPAPTRATPSTIGAWSRPAPLGYHRERTT